MIVRHKLTGKNLIVLKGVALSGGGGSPYAVASNSFPVRDKDMNVFWVIDEEVELEGEKNLN